MSYGMDGWNKPGGDSISRAAAINAICEDGTRLERNGRYRMTMVERKQRDVDILEALPSAHPEQKRGEWIYDSSKMGGYKCSVCGKACSTFKYCPNCGARMEVRE